MLNEFREKELDLPPLTADALPGRLLWTHRVPMTYCWSSSVVPRPDDWPPTRYEAKALREGRSPRYWTFTRR